MQYRFLDNKLFYDTFLKEISDVQCGNHYDETNPQHVEWLKNYVDTLYLRGGEALCLYSDEDEPLGFIYLLHDKGLEKVKCFGNKATIAMFEIKEDYRSKGYGTLLLKEAENHLRNRGAECLYTDTPDDLNDRGALVFYVRNGFTPIACHPGENGKDDWPQVYLFMYL
jgi:ribosomal protein S18 acetylase RimI-like enzyme